MSSRYGRTSSAVAGLPYAIRITASLTARPVSCSHEPGTVPGSPASDRFPAAASQAPSLSARTKGLSLGPGRSRRGSCGHQGRLMHEPHEPAKHLWVGLRQHAVAEVEDVSRPAARALEHLARAG